MSGNDARDRRDKANPAQTDDDLSARLERLGSEIDARRAVSPRVGSGPKSSGGGANAYGQAVRLSAEFVAGVIAGGVVGWLVDRLVGSSPWGLIVCLILGFCAGMLNLLRASGTVQPARSRD